MIDMNKNKSAEALRLRAEEHLKEKTQEVLSPVVTAELQRLVHELEVHQIELEMQNEELQQTRQQLEEHLREYTELYDFAPVGYCTLNNQGLILQANLSLVSMLGVERSRLVNQHFANFVSDDSRLDFISIIEKAFRKEGQENPLLELKKDGGRKFYARMAIRLSEDVLNCRIALLDITAQILVEQKLQLSERNFRTLFETMPQGVLLMNVDEKITSVNPSAASILGQSIDEILKKQLKDPGWRFINEDGTDFPRENHPSLVALRIGKTIKDVVMGLIPTSEHGDCIWLLVNAIPQFSVGEDQSFQVFVIFEDITFHKRILVYNTLTQREKEVFRRLILGMSRSIIAETLKISPKTVDKHKENLMEKLHLYTNKGMVDFSKSIGWT